MTGWDLLETLAELADKEPDKLDANIYALLTRDLSPQTIVFNPQKIEYTIDTVSKNQGIFLTRREDNKNE